MADFSMTIRLDGDAEMMRRLAALPDKAQRKVLRPAVVSTMRILTKAAKTELSAQLAGRVVAYKRTGALLASIGQQVFTAKTADKSIIGRVGTRGSKGRGVKTAILAGGYHGWLVEHGHRLVRGGSVVKIGIGRGIPKAVKAERRGRGKVVGQVPPHPFLKPAFAGALSSMQTTMRARVFELLARVAGEPA